MSTPSLQKSYSYYDITQYVNAYAGQNDSFLSLVGAQLQKIKCLRNRESGDWLMEFDFFPGPRRSLWVGEASLSSWGWLTGDRPPEGIFSNAQNPLFLYIKSHFVGRRLGGVKSIGERQTEWDFGEGYCWILSLKATNSLECLLEVPGKKPFVKELKLYPSAFFLEELSVEAQAALPSKVRQVGKQGRLLENIRVDLASAREWVSKYAPLCLELQNRPWLWHRPEDTYQDGVWVQKIEELQKSGLLPKTRDASHLKAALDKLFHERSRQERKIVKASARLSEIEGRIDAGDLYAEHQVQKPKLVSDRNKEKSHPGLKVEVVAGIYGYLGRNSRENEVLFKWVRDRDFWFHVRGYSGTHLWILRSDLALPKDAPLPKDIAERGAKIALWNSKLKNSGSGPVDITEKRHLKKLKGEAGQLKITKSEVLFVTLEEGFEKTLKWD